MTIVLDESSLTIEQLAAIARDPRVRVELDPATSEPVAREGRF
jgi:histidine ammonia-lyase